MFVSDDVNDFMNGIFTVMQVSCKSAVSLWQATVLSSINAVCIIFLLQVPEPFFLKPCDYISCGNTSELGGLAKPFVVKKVHVLNSENCLNWFFEL